MLRCIRFMACCGVWLVLRCNRLGRKGGETDLRAGQEKSEKYDDRRCLPGEPHSICY